MTTTLDDSTLEANSYAVAYRLLGDRPAAMAVSGIATQRLRQHGEPLPENWLTLLTTYTIDQTVGPAALGVRDQDADPLASMRAALRRRLERATPQERVAGALIQLAGYPPEFVGPLMQTTPEHARTLAGVLAPPPGVAYRDLGDPELIGSGGYAPRPSRRRRRPHWTTILALVVLCAALFYATQVTGPRPTLVDEGGLGVEHPASHVIDVGGVGPVGAAGAPGGEDVSGTLGRSAN